tara:strand:- start:19974 stop:20837 length:864 start_codon:yes stop_codon:yes gene_type:complete
MAINNFNRALTAVLVHEGGYVNHPRDPGGATNKGITYRTYNAWRKSQGQKPRDVRNITDKEVAAIYKKQYWDAVKADELPSGLDNAVFDYAVNSGPGRAAKDLQRVLGVTPDGSVGSNTLAAAKGKDASASVNQLCDRRMAFFRSLKTWGTFGKGWTRRLVGVRALSLELAKTKTPAPAPKPVMVVNPPKEKDIPVAVPVKASPTIDEQVIAKAEPSDIAISRTQEVTGSVIAAAGTAGSVLTETAEKLSIFQEYSTVIKGIFIALLIAGVALTIYASIKRIRATEH